LVRLQLIQSARTVFLTTVLPAVLARGIYHFAGVKVNSPQGAEFFGSAFLRAGAKAHCLRSFCPSAAKGICPLAWGAALGKGLSGQLMESTGINGLWEKENERASPIFFVGNYSFGEASHLLFPSQLARRVSCQPGQEPTGASSKMNRCGEETAKLPRLICCFCPAEPLAKDFLA